MADPDQEQVLSYLSIANGETSALIGQIACVPRGAGSELPVVPVVHQVDEMILALVETQGWGWRRIHGFLTKASVAGVPSPRTVANRVRRVKGGL